MIVRLLLAYAAAFAAAVAVPSTVTAVIVILEFRDDRKRTT